MYAQSTDKPRTANRQELMANFTDRQYSAEDDTYARHRNWNGWTPQKKEPPHEGQRSEQIQFSTIANRTQGGGTACLDPL